MENPSPAEQPTPEGPPPSSYRPPGLEFAMGVALFAVTIIVFMLVQTAVFLRGVLRLSPELAPDGFSFGLLGDAAFRARMEELMLHGDLVAVQALWSGLAGIIFLAVTVTLWKRGDTVRFLGLGAPRLRDVARWFGIFLLLAVVIEGLAYISPAFQTDFMEKVIGSSSNKLLLLLGVGLMAPLFEELLLRGLLLGSLRHLSDEHTSVAISAGVFAVMHLQYSWPIMLLIIPMGVVLGYARTRSGSLWVPILLHVANNTASVFWP